MDEETVYNGQVGTPREGKRYKERDENVFKLEREREKWRVGKSKKILFEG